jgi:hypothetical protein
VRTIIFSEVWHERKFDGTLPEAREKALVGEMKITLESTEDVKAINWLQIAERIADHARKKIAEVMDRAADDLKHLAPGETRTYVIEFGTVEISRDIEGAGKLEATSGRSNEVKSEQGPVTVSQEPE